jgi:DNA ligase D-like protein (predicted ligase)
MNPIKPMLAVTGKPFSSKDWIFEPKIDGTRCIAHIQEGVVLQNRRLMNISYRYPEIVEALADAASDCVLDGEIAVFYDGKPDFASLAEREHQTKRLRIEYLSKTMPASYVVFDILYANGENVMSLPLAERKEILKKELQENDIVTLADYFPERGEDYYQAALKLGIEGIMAKRLASIYQPGVRSPDWVKIKKRFEFDLVVGGYIPGKGHRESYFGGLLLGAYNSGKLVYVGRVGSGFSDKELQEMIKSFKPTSATPFSNPPGTPGIKWLKPDIVVEVAAMEVTENGCLRAPVFLRRRFDKAPQECSMDQIESQLLGVNKFFIVCV